MRKRLRTSYSDSETEEGGINLTPLIDVVFVVLILFILIAPMIDLDSVSLASGKTRQNVETISHDGLTIHVHEDNTIWIDHKQVSIDSLAMYLKVLYRQNPGRVPMLYHDQKAYFGTYQTVKNALEEAGFSKLNVVLKHEAN